MEKEGESGVREEKWRGKGLLHCTHFPRFVHIKNSPTIWRRGLRLFHCIHITPCTEKLHVTVTENIDVETDCLQWISDDSFCDNPCKNASQWSD